MGALPPHPRTVDLKVSEMSAFGPPRGCASGSLWVNISKKESFFIKNEGFVKLRKKNMVIFQNGFSPKAASRQPRVFGDPENPMLESPKSKNIN